MDKKVCCRCEGNAIEILAQYKDTGLTPEEITEMMLDYCKIREQKEERGYQVRKLKAENEQLEQRLEKTDNYQAYKREKRIRIGLEEKVVELEQRLEKAAELPCKVGDSFYGVQEDGNYYEYDVKSFKVTKDKLLLVAIYGIQFEYGKNAFLTEAEAEKALEELEGKE